MSITQPEAIKTIHGKYFEAGADIVETNTFSGTTIAMADYQLEDLVYELNYQSAKIAKEVAAEFTAKEPHKPRFVAGSIGPTNRTASMSPDVNDPGYRAVTFKDLRISYKQQVEALIDGGVDLLLVETVFDTLNAKAALFAIEEAKRQCDYLIVGLQLDPSIDRPEKNSPSQSIIERYIQLKGSKHIDEIVPYVSEQDLEDILRSFKLDVRIIGDEYKEKNYTGREYCEEKGIEIYYNSRDHRFSSSSLRKQVKEKSKT